MSSEIARFLTLDERVDQWTLRVGATFTTEPILQIVVETLVGAGLEAEGIKLAPVGA